MQCILSTIHELQQEHILLNVFSICVTPMVIPSSSSWHKRLPIADGFLRYVIGIRYNGSNYCGWESNGENSKLSISETLQNAIDQLTGPNSFMNLRLSSRTDAGVHALRNVLQVDLIRRKHQIPGGKLLEPLTPDNVRRGMNYYLGKKSEKLYVTDVSVVHENSNSNATDADSNTIALDYDFDVRGSATGRKYIYQIACPKLILNNDTSVTSTNISSKLELAKRTTITNKSVRGKQYFSLYDPRDLLFHNDLMWVYNRPLDIHAMNDACQYFLGIHDFTSFRSSSCQSVSPFREIKSLTVNSVSLSANSSETCTTDSRQSFSDIFYLVILYLICHFNIL